MIQKTCAYGLCGRSFPVPPNNRVQRYCSKRCSSTANATAHGMYLTRERACDRCGTLYPARKPTSRFCSDACRVVATGYGRSYGNIAPRQFGVWRQGGAG